MTNKRYSHFHLSNGIEVITYPIKEVRAVAIQMGLGYGSGIEEEDEEGTLHFLEHTLFQGTQKFPTERAVNIYSEELGVSDNASVGTNATHFWFLTPDTSLKETLYFATQIVAFPIFPEDAIEKTRTVILNEQRNFWDVPENQFYTEANKRVLGKDHPYTKLGFGKREVVLGMTRDKLLKTYNRFYSPSNLKISLAGNFIQDQIKDILEETIGRWDKEDSFSGELKPKHPEIKTAFFVFNQPRKQVIFNLSFPSFGYKEAEPRKRLIFNIFGFMLGGGLNSALTVRLREELGLVYYISSRPITWPYLGRLSVNASIDSEQLAQATEEILNVLRRVKEEGFKEKDFKRAISYVSAQILIRFSDIDKISDHFLWNMIDKEEVLLPRDYVSILNTIKVDEVNQIAKEILNFKKMNLALMGDEKEIEKSGIKKSFEK